MPIKLIKSIRDNRDKNYSPIYKSSIPIEKQNIRRETLSIIAVLDLNYWCENEEEKIKLKNKIDQNELKYQKELERKYNIDNLFKNKKTTNNNINTQNSLLVPIKEKRFFTKILEKIKLFFHH